MEVAVGAEEGAGEGTEVETGAAFGAHEANKKIKTAAAASSRVRTHFLQACPSSKASMFHMGLAVGSRLK